MNTYQPTNVKFIIALLAISVIIIGCEGTTVSVVHVDPQDGSSIEPTLPAIIVTFDGPLENFEATKDYKRSGNTVTFSGPFKLGDKYAVEFSWDKTSGFFEATNRDSMNLTYRVTSGAVVTITDDPNAIKLLPPWPSLANLESGDPNVDVLRFEVPIYIDRALAYDLPVSLAANAFFTHLRYSYALGRFIHLNYGIGATEAWPSNYVIEKGRTETLCVIEIEAINYTDPNILSNLDGVKIRILHSPRFEIGSPSGIIRNWAISAP